MFSTRKRETREQETYPGGNQLNSPEVPRMKSKIHHNLIKYYHNTHIEIITKTN